MSSIEPELITTDELAVLLSVSKKFIEKHRNRIAGRLKIGGQWRYQVAIIRKRISTGKDVLE